MGEAVSCCCKDVRDAGVNIGIVAGVTAQLFAHGFVTHNVWQVVPEHEHLTERGEGVIAGTTEALEMYVCKGKVLLTDLPVCMRP